jgi:hypothetical protein
MDEDEEREFSSGIVLGFLDQAESTFKSMESALYAMQADFFMCMLLISCLFKAKPKT